MKFFHTITRFTAAMALLLLCGAGIAKAQWQTVAPVPVSGDYWGFGSAYHNGKIYTFGGVFAGSTQLTNSTYTLDISGGTPTWGTGPNMFAGAYNLTATTLNNRIYVFGGQNGAQSVANFFTTASSLDPVGGSFRQEPAMPRPATNAVAVSVGNKAFILGGLTLVTVSGQTSLTNTTGVLVFDASTNSWTETPNGIPYAAYNMMATTTADGTIYLAGGQNVNGQGFTSAYKGTVSGNTITWTQIAQLPAVVAGGGMSLLNGKVMVAGGISVAENFRGAYVYDEANNKWDAYYQLPSNHVAGALVGDGTTPYMIGGNGTTEVLRATVSEAQAVASVGETEFHIALKTGNQRTIKIPVGNLGVIDLTAELEIDGSTPWITGTSATVTPGSTQELTATINAASLADGRYKVNATIATNDPDQASIPVVIDVWVVNDLVQTENKVVLEESHGTWCPPCGEYGVPAVEALMGQYGDQLIVLSHHDKGGSRYDPFSITAGETLNQRLGLNAYPTGAVQRWMKNGSYQLSAGAEWAEAIAEVLEESEYAKANVEVTDYEYNEATREASGNIVITTAAPMTWTANSSLRATVVVTESGYSYTQQFVTQAPRAIEHKHVTRHFWPNIDGQAVSLGSDATVDAGTLLKPGLSYTVPFSFTVPTATTPTSSAAGEPTSVPVTPANCDIVFLVHTNQGSTLGPILGAHEMKLVQGTPGPAVTIQFPGQVSKDIAPEQTAEFAVNVTNNRNEPVEVRVNRQETIPNSWMSEICTGAADCDDANLVNYTIPANGTHTFTLKVHGMSASESGTVRLVFTAGDIVQDQTFTVNTGVSGVAVAGEAGGLSMTSVTPNPASSVTRIDVMIPTGAQTVLEVYSITGQKVATLFEGRLEAGNRQIDANVSSLESGKYVLVLTSGDKKVSRTLTIVR